jgi:RHS repeat-associated protein
MSLMAETELTTNPGAPAVLYEYIWFNGQPVAQIDAGPVTHWTFTDHLGTPLIQTDTAGAIYWRAEHEPYGKIFALRTADQHQPLRLPGQEAEQLNLGPNGATERSYNIFRWYKNGWGRYTQPDPIKATLPEMPLLTYAYAGDSPLRFTDPDGLYRIDPNFPSECRPALDQAISIVQNAFNRIPGCSDCPPSAIGRTYKSLLDDPNLVIGHVERSRVSPCAYGETPWYVDPRTGQFTAAPNPRVTGFACRMGRWMLARAIVHELTHVGGASFEAAAYAREARCGFPPLNPARYGCPP